MRRYENFKKMENGKWLFLGWYPMQEERFCIDTKTRVTNGKTYIYKTYKYLNGDIEVIKYGSYVDVEV